MPSSSTTQSCACTPPKLCQPKNKVKYTQVCMLENFLSWALTMGEIEFHNIFFIWYYKYLNKDHNISCIIVLVNVHTYLGLFYKGDVVR